MSPSLSPLHVAVAAYYEPPRLPLLSGPEALATLFSIHSKARPHQRDHFRRMECEELADHLPCHVIPGIDGGIYLRRYGVADLADGGHVYLHLIKSSDSDDQLHGHPWPARALILVAGYNEERRVPDSTHPTGYAVETRRYEPGDVNTIEPDTYHRIDLHNGPAWTILITGPKIVRAEGDPSWNFWDRDTGVTTGYEEFLAAKGMKASPTPKNLASKMTA